MPPENSSDQERHLSRLFAQRRQNQRDDAPPFLPMWERAHRSPVRRFPRPIPWSLAGATALFCLGAWFFLQPPPLEKSAPPVLTQAAGSGGPLADLLASIEATLPADDTLLAFSSPTDFLLTDLSHSNP